MPPVVPSRVDLRCKDAVVYLPDIYQGPGLKGFPRGSIQRLRVGSHHFRYAGNGEAPGQKPVALRSIPARSATLQRIVEVVECDIFIHTDANLFNSAKPYYI